MVDPSTSAEDVLYVRRRSLSVLLGSACAVALGFVVPQMAQAGLITIPIWRRVLTRKAGGGRSPEAPKRPRRKIGV